MAPEALSKIPYNAFFAERWSLGILLYEILEGRCPFVAETSKELFYKIKSGEYTYRKKLS